MQAEGFFITQPSVSNGALTGCVQRCTHESESLWEMGIAVQICRKKKNKAVSEVPVVNILVTLHFKLQWLGKTERKGPDVIGMN